MPTKLASINEPQPARGLAPAFVEAMAAILEDAVAQLQVLAEIAPLHPAASSASPVAQSGAAALQAGAGMMAALNNDASPDGTLKRVQLLPQLARQGSCASDTLSAAHGATAGTSMAKLQRGAEAKTGRERQMLESLLELSIGELRSTQQLSSLQSAVDEEVQRRSLLSDTQQRERDRSHEMREMQRQLQAEATDLDAQRAERDGIIVQLREAIQEINSLTAAEQRYFTKAARARECALRAQCSAKEAGVESAVITIRETQATELRIHDAVMAHLAARRGALETQIVEWMERHERDTEAKSAELEALKASRLRDNDKFEEYAARYDELEQQIHEDQVSRAQEIELRRSKGNEMRREKAARAIQKEWRAYVQRRGGRAGGVGGAPKSPNATRERSAKKSGSAKTKKSGSSTPRAASGGGASSAKKGKKKK